MKYFIIFAIAGIILFAGCTLEGSPSPSPTPTQAPIVPEGSPTVSPSPSPTPAPFPINISSPPVIELSNVTVLIRWETSIPSDSSIEYGVSTKYDLIKSVNDNSTSHNIDLSDLQFLTTYHLRVISCSGDNCVKSDDYNFTTGHKECIQEQAYIAEGDFCIDKFENTIEQKKAVSRAGKVPTFLVSRDEAQAACNAVGKRLCTSDEFTAACNIRGVKEGRIGEAECHVRNTSFMRAGLEKECLSDQAVRDLIGNFWEWVSDDVTKVTPFYDGLVDRDDILTAGANYELPRQANTETEKRGGDYYSNAEPDRNQFIGKGIVRGGDWNDYGLAGCYAYKVGVSLEGDGNIGFRCCS